MSLLHRDFDRFLTDISSCFIENDFNAWRCRVHLPLSLVTRNGQVLVPDEDLLELNFDLYMSSFYAMRIDTILRDPLLLEPCDDGTWLGTYETRLISRGTLACPVYVSTALLHDVDGWTKTSSVMNARGHYDKCYSDRASG